MNNACAIIKENEHGFLLGAALDSLPWTLGAFWSPFCRFLLGLWIKQQDPCLVSSDDMLQEVRVVAVLTQVLLTEAFPESALFFCQLVWHKLGTVFGQFQVFLEDLLHSGRMQICLFCQIRDRDTPVIFQQLSDFIHMSISFPWTTRAWHVFHWCGLITTTETSAPDLDLGFGNGCIPKDSLQVTPNLDWRHALCTHESDVGALVDSALLAGHGEGCQTQNDEEKSNKPDHDNVSAVASLE